jgi:hypothetical protein
MKKKLKIALIFAILPFILVWTAGLLTAFSFIPREIFQHGAFWFISIIYWFMYLVVIIPAIAESNLN